MKAIITNVGDGGDQSTAISFSVSFIDTTTNPSVITHYYADILVFGSDVTSYTTQEITGRILTMAKSYATANSLTLADADYLFISPSLQPDWEQADTGKPDFIKNKPSLLPRSFDNSPTRTIQTVASAANGFQISASRDTFVTYSCNINTTASIGGNSDGSIVLEICPTNSSVSGNWLTISKLRNSQAFTLAITLQSVQNIGCNLIGMVPAGYYARLRSITTNGSPVFAFDSGQEVLL